MAVILQQPKTAALAKRKPEQEKQLATGRQKQLMSASEKLMDHALQYGIRGELFKCAALWNIHNGKLHMLYGQSFAEYCESIGITKQWGHECVRFGAEMQAAALDALKADGWVENPDEPFAFTQKIVEFTFDGFFTNGHDVSTKRLMALAKVKGALSELVNGKLKPAEAMKLLEANNNLSDKEIDNRAKAILSDEEITRRFHEKQEAVALAHGFVWDRETYKFAQSNGEPLTPEQEAEVMPFDEGLRVWAELEREWQRSIVKSAQTIRKEGIHWVNFSRIQNSLRDKHVQDARHRLHQLQETLSMMEAALMDGNLDEVEEIAKKGVEV